MKFLANAICSALVSASTDDMALLQARNVQVHSQPVTLPGPTCVVAGDPHIRTFDMDDGLTETCLGPMGDYILMENNQLYVYGRYRGFQRENGYAFVQGLVIGGDAIGGQISVPTHNNGCITYKGNCLEKPGGINSFDLGNGVSLTIRKAPGPDLVNFIGPESMVDTARLLTYYIELKKDGLLDFLVVVNQGQFQHVMISGSTSALEGTTGQCGNNNGDSSDDHFNVDACVGKLPCEETCLFGVCPNPECDKPREPEECKNDAEKVAYFKDICEEYFGSDAYATTHYLKPGDHAREWQVWNCITDCCGDRDTCPDLGNEGEWGDCLIQGDPHIKTWDSGVLNKNAFGPLDDYILVKNEYINVQGRYGSQRGDNKAQLFGVAVSGQLVGGSTIVFPTGYEHPPTIDGVDMVGSRYHTPEFTIRYEEKGLNLHFLFDKTTPKRTRGKKRPLYVVVMTDPADGKKLGRVRVNRARGKKSNAMACHITMQSALLTGVSGQCGNFNGDRLDDNSKEEDIVSTAENLFPSANPQQGLAPVPRECRKHQKKKARRCCKARHGEVALSEIEACVIDNCCGEDKPCNPRTECMAGFN